MTNVGDALIVKHKKTIMPSCIYNKSSERTCKFYRESGFFEMMFHQNNTNFLFWQITIEYEKKNNFFVK